MDQGRGQRQPQAQLGATFYPGGIDDFYMPEVVSPAPKRLMPEVPDNIQDNLARLELEGTPAHANRLSGLRSPSPFAEMPGSEGHQSRSSSVSNLTTFNEPGPLNNMSKQALPFGAALDQPTFSPFPRLEQRPPNVPPSDQEKEAILESARVPVLNSNDPEMQLTWAQDALAFVEIAAQDAARVSERQAARPQTPRTEHQLRIDAINVVSFLADQNHPKAEFMRGMWLEFGKFNFRMDKKEAFRCYSRAASNGYARAEYRMGMQFESSNDPGKALIHYLRGVDAGDSASNYVSVVLETPQFRYGRSLTTILDLQRLGMMTLLGQHGQNLDYIRGVDLIKKAAETADENAPQGAYVFGMLQARELKQISMPDHILPLDMIGARFNIEKAAYLGFAKAQTKMGAAYELGQLGCEFDPALSLHYNALASRQGEPEADMAISKWFLCGQKGLFDKSDELAFTYAERAAQTGLPTAEFAVGYFYEIGIHVRSDLNESRIWYTKAADHGYAEALGRIEGLSRSNTLTKKDHQDIAIARIRSTHGSQRKPRTDRYKTNEQMPTIPDSSQDAPVFNPTKPYPEDRRSYSSAAGNIQRPVSSAPYPDDNTFGYKPSLRPNNPGTYSNPNLRVGSDTRPLSVATVASAPLNGAMVPPSVAQSRPPRSSSSQDNLAGSRGRGMPHYGSGSGISGSAGYRQPSSGLNNVQRMESPGPPVSPQLSNIDIGFSAPLDLSGADRKGRLQKAGNRHPAGPGPGPGPGPGSGSRPMPAQAAPVKPPPQRLANIPDTQNFTRQSRTSSPSRQTNSRPGSSHGNQPAGGFGTRPPNSPSLPALPPKVPAMDSPAPTTPPSSTSRPPGKGPKTFEEMGVPAQKQKDECVSSSADCGRDITNAIADIDVSGVPMEYDLEHSEVA
ncbi:MAG: hypothetical protein Q9178_000961 [Gyalolechia marmorata]